jgi:hypothetical protein
MRVRAIAASLSLVVCAQVVLPQGAHAAAAEPIVKVRLKNGDIYSGSIVERVAGDHITIRTVTGKLQTVAWDDLAEVPSQERAAAPAEAADESTKEEEEEKTEKRPAPRLREPASTGAVDAIEVSLRGDGVFLERSLGTSSGTLSVGARGGQFQVEHWERICTAPCTVSVPRGDYRVSGRDRRSSDTLTLDSDASIRADLGSPWLRMFGWTTLVFGITTIAIGTPLFVLGATSSDSQSLGGTGILLGVVGAVLVVASVPMFVGSANDVRVEGGQSHPKESSASIRFIGNGFTF